MNWCSQYINPKPVHISNMQCNSGLHIYDETLIKSRRYREKQRRYSWNQKPQLPPANSGPWSHLPCTKKTARTTNWSVKYLNGFTTATARGLFHYDPNDGSINNEAKLIVKYFNTSVAQHFYPIKITTTWNALATEIVSSRSVNSFKNSLGNLCMGRNSPKICPRKLVAIIDAVHNSRLLKQS